MEMMDDNLVLVDTNILLYLYNDNEEIKNKFVNKVEEFKGNKLFMSEQIVREFLVAQSNIQKIAGKVDLVKLVEDTKFIYYNFSIIYPSAHSLRNYSI